MVMLCSFLYCSVCFSVNLFVYSELWWKISEEPLLLVCCLCPGSMNGGFGLLDVTMAAIQVCVTLLMGSPICKLQLKPTLKYFVNKSSRT